MKNEIKWKESLENKSYAFMNCIENPFIMHTVIEFLKMVTENKDLALKAAIFILAFFKLRLE